MVLDTPSSQVLDYDVLLAVMSQCDKSSVASLMRTCSTMYHAGAKHVLDGNVLLWNPGLIDSFCHFMLAEDGTRFRLLRELTLATGSVPKKAIPMLLKVILKMDHLESLKMMDSENLLASHLKLSKHIVRLPGLRHLTLHNACARTTQMVRRIRSKLITFHIDYGAVDDGTFLESLDDVERLRHHPAFLCQAFRSSLEEMVTAYDDPHEEQPHSDALVYPNLWKLRVYEELPWAHPYVCTFPNVTHLSIRSLYDTEPFSDDLMVEYMQHRQISMQKQMDRGTWLKLREYDGGPLGLFLIGLTCRIPRVSLHPIRRDNLQLLESILDSAKPEVLQLSVVHADIFGPSDKELPAILRLPCCATLKKVQISVDIGLEARNVNISNSMVALIVSDYCSLSADCASCIGHVIGQSPRIADHTIDREPGGQARSHVRSRSDSSNVRC